ncbi:type III PLP-dependent enzyme [Sphingobium bisphenolivorans]|uniref:type III PLP-dependent enzyme n=1 Tax=Sphingobium bisphenolivorans TaxID=1335760 RepID=UPI00039E7EA4|nr:type III PLP-dependent enzyme [Sphingobium bisphenolivorans]
MTALSDSVLAEAADGFGTPCFIYATSAIEERIGQLRAAFGSRFALSFAVKSNPNPALLGWLNRRIDSLDISSIGEMRLALAAGWDAARISFTGPAKRADELREAIAAGIGLLIVESVREARAADTIARAMKRVQPILIRIAPDSVPRGFGDHMAGRPSAFGIDLEDAEEALDGICGLPGLSVQGLHIYSGTQCLKAEAIVENYRGFLAIFESLCARHAIDPRTLVFGSGLGVPYHDGDTPFDLAAVAEAIGPDLDRFTTAAPFRHSSLVLELGRYLVAEAGYFLTRVVSVKQSRGTRIAICDGGMNNHLPASGHFGMVIRRNYRMHKVGGEGAPEKIDIVGPLCTSIDRLASGVELPRVEEGDIIAVHQSGAYGLTASPIHFISHAPPAELMVVDGELRDVSRFFDEGADTGSLRLRA